MRQSGYSFSWGRGGVIMARIFCLFCIFFSQGPLLVYASGKEYPLLWHLILSLTLLPLGGFGLRRFLYARAITDDCIEASWMLGKKTLKISQIDYFTIGEPDLLGFKSLDFRHGAYVRMKGKIPFIHVHHVSSGKDVALALQLLKKGVPYKMGLAPWSHLFTDMQENQKQLERIKSQEL